MFPSHDQGGGEVFHLSHREILPESNRLETVSAYENQNHDTFLEVNMVNPSRTRKHGFVLWLKAKFIHEMHLYVSMYTGFRFSDKELILQYLNTYDIQECEYSTDAAKKSWQRLKQRLMNNPVFYEAREIINPASGKRFLKRRRGKHVNTSHIRK